MTTFMLGPDTRATILTTGDDTGGHYDITEVVHAPGARTPLHVHTRYEERHYVLAGSFTLWAGEEQRTLEAGGFNRLPPHVPHAIQSGPDGSRALVISSPAGFAELVARAGSPADGLAAELDLEHLAAVSADLGDVMLGPPGTTPGDLPPRS
jgi:quercetin dioxygenase-like cupin family protein